MAVVPENRDICGFSELIDVEKTDMYRLFPREGAGAGWFGRKRAEEIIKAFLEKINEL